MNRKLFGLIGAIGIAFGVGSCKSVSTTKYKDSTEYVHIHLKDDYGNNKITAGTLKSYEFLDNGMIKCEVVWHGYYDDHGIQMYNTNSIICLLPIEDVILYSHGYCSICTIVI